MKGKELKNFEKKLTEKEKEAVEALMKENDSLDVWDVKEIEDGVLVSAFGVQLQLYKDGEFRGLNPHYEKNQRYFEEKPKYLEQMRPQNWESFLKPKK